MYLIDERDERTKRRKAAKKYFDSLITLSAGTEEKKTLSVSLNLPVADRPARMRLLDEGSVITADDDIDFYIEKGTLRKYYESIPDNFVGTINLGHLPFSSFPFLLGEWRKENIHLVDIGDGREAIDIDNTIDYDSVFVKELLRMPYSIGISAEFAFLVDEEASEEKGVEMLDGVFIFAYGLVGDAGNVNSSGITLGMKGEDMTLEELNKKLGIGELEMTEEVTEETAEEVVEVEETVEETTEEEEVVEETEGVAEEADESDEMFSVMADVIEKLSAKVDELTAEVTAMKTAKEAAEKELAVSQEKDRKRLEKFKTLYPSLAEEPTANEEPEVTETVLRTDGIGEW